MLIQQLYLVFFNSLFCTRSRYEANAWRASSLLQISTQYSVYTKHGNFVAFINLTSWSPDLPQQCCIVNDMMNHFSPQSGGYCGAHTRTTRVNCWVPLSWNTERNQHPHRGFWSWHTSCTLTETYSTQHKGYTPLWRLVDAFILGLESPWGFFLFSSFLV